MFCFVLCALFNGNGGGKGGPLNGGGERGDVVSPGNS